MNDRVDLEQMFEEYEDVEHGDVVRELFEAQQAIRSMQLSVEDSLRKVGVAQQARRDLIQVLELDDDMSWDDVVYYATKAKSSLRMSNATVGRRTEQLVAVLGAPSDTTWPAALSMVRHVDWADHVPEQVQTRLIEIAEEIKYGYPEGASYLRRLASGWGAKS